MKDKFYRFMQGRYGVDQFAKFTMGVALVSIVLAIFVNTGSSAGSLLDMLGLVAIVYTYFRIFSRNISKRAQENQKYLSATAKLRQRLNKEKNMMKQRKDYHIYTCPSCGQKVRIPRGKGKIKVICPHCKHEEIKKS